MCADWRQLGRFESCFELFGFIGIEFGGFPAAWVAGEDLEGCAADRLCFVYDFGEGFLDVEVYAYFEWASLV